MIISFLFLTIGFLLLWKGADFMVEGATKISDYFKIPEIIVGLSLLAFGTSAPELFVNLFAVFEEKPDIIFGNIIGSNIANTLLILGCTSLIFPLYFNKRSLYKELPFSLFLSILLCLFIVKSGSFLLPWHSVIFLFIFAAFLYFLVRYVGLEKTDTSIELKKISLSRGVFEFLGGLTALPFGAKYVISSATSLSAMFSIPEAIISLFAVALGTSLPELVTSLVAAIKRKPDMVVGNIIGSNIFNILFVLGICGLFAPLPFTPSLFIDLIIMIISILFLFTIILINKKNSLNRIHGFLLLLSYTTYIGYLYYRGIIL